MGKYFITGRGGFIGKKVLEYLSGEEIVDDIVPGCTVVHLAAYGNHYFQKEADKIIVANILDLYDLIIKAQENNVAKFYNISTSSVTLPVQTMYSATKLCGETLINSLNDERYVNVRPYSVYGPGEADHRFIPTIIRHLKSGEKMFLDPAPSHDWILVQDFVKAMFDGYKSIGTGTSYTNIEIVKALEKISGKRLNYEEKQLRSYDGHNWVSPTSVPHINIYDGLKLTWEASL